MIQPLLEMQLLALFAFVLFSFLHLVCRLDAKEWTCKLGIPYKENECNGCICSGYHKMGCRMMGCLGDHYEKLKNCVPGTTTQRECNTCVCVSNIGTICTDHQC